MELLLRSLQTIIPTVIVVCFGANVVNFILDVIPQWVTAGMLPVVGIGTVMVSLLVKKFLPFILIGFILSAYLSMPGARNCDCRICRSILVFYDRNEKSRRGRESSSCYNSG